MVKCNLRIIISFLLTMLSLNLFCSRYYSTTYVLSFLIKTYSNLTKYPTLNILGCLKPTLFHANICSSHLTSCRRNSNLYDWWSLGVNFINIKLENFSYEHRFGSFYYVHVTRKKLPKWLNLVETSELIIFCCLLATFLQSITKIDSSLKSKPTNQANPFDTDGTEFKFTYIHF